MNIGLIDLDKGKFPNLALMKIASWYKKNLFNVEWHDPLRKYDTVFIAKVFTYTLEADCFINSKNIIKGGTGYNLTDNLPIEMETIMPDYTLYGIDYAMGFLTRGCSRGCKFCIVNEKEGCSHKVSDLHNFYSGQKEIKLLDPNILEYHNHEELLYQLIKSKAYIDFTQGLDIRLLNDRNLSLINELKLKRVHFAWDNMNDHDIIIENLTKYMKNNKHNRRNTSCYMLTNFNTSMEENILRVKTLKKMDIQPYVMIYNKHLLKKKSILHKLQRYVNNPFVFWKVNSFDEYIYK